MGADEHLDRSPNVFISYLWWQWDPQRVGEGTCCISAKGRGECHARSV